MAQQVAGNNLIALMEVHVMSAYDEDLECESILNIELICILTFKLFIFLSDIFTYIFSHDVFIRILRIFPSMTFNLWSII